MLDQLIANQGKDVIVELISGKKITGKLIAVNEGAIRLDAEEGIGMVPIGAIQVIWEGREQTISEENMEYLANQLRNNDDTRINCTARPGFNCANRYVCVPPDNCERTFACPGVYTPGPPQGGCSPYQFYNPCYYRFEHPCTYDFHHCTYQFQHPCTYNFHHCTHQFQHPCTYSFHHPCTYQFQQPCTYNFHQPCTYNFGSQCGTVGGFTCPGQAFFGVAHGSNTEGK